MSDIDIYADDTVICFSAATINQASYLQSAFNVVQEQLYQLKLVLNVEKTKLMLFSSIFQAFLLYRVSRSNKSKCTNIWLF